MATKTATEKVKRRGRPVFEFEDGREEEIFHSIRRAVSLKRNAPDPIWSVIKDEIAHFIRSEELKPDSRLPSEQALCELFNVSRPVIRTAIRALSDEGLVRRLPRKGMFVSPNRGSTDFLSTNLSVFGDMVAKGHSVDTKTLSFARRAASDDEIRMLDLEPGGSVISIARVYIVDGRPITFTQLSLPGERLPDMEKLDIENRSIHETIRLHFGFEVKRADRWFAAGPATEQVAAHMGVSLGMPMIIIDSLAYDQNDRPIELYHSYYDSNVARIHLKV